MKFIGKGIKFGTKALGGLFKGGSKAASTAAHTMKSVGKTVTSGASKAAQTVK